ncbi:CHAT domain-containing protein [Streptomyces bottropensis]|uniref:CHAT domain-containing protein n=1 Tax=Streptomyces bottropensis TaxID=42235 RepID=UPI00382086FE
MTEAETGPVNPVDRRMALAREWDRLVEQVREMPDFRDFLRPPRLETLLPAAAGGPVVIVNVSRWRCDALIVTTRDARNLPLPGLTLDRATEQANLYLRTLQEAERAGQEHQSAAEAAQAEPGPAAVRAQRRAAQALIDAEQRTDEMLQELQQWLWEAVAAPVLQELGMTGRPAPEAPWPRLWWCPTGPLTLLPLHSAGHHGTRDDRVPLTVLDRAVCSYTPTLRALLEARTDRRAPGEPGAVAEDRFLLVAVEDAPGQVPLDGVTEELDVLARLLPPEPLTVLRGAAATRRTVGDELARHSWVHFSCHGDQDLTEPSRGGLLLHDGMLTIGDISARHHRAEFAGLSACKTAVGGVHLLDETITLAAALHYTGYRHVVAALWSVDQEAAAEVFTALYGELVTEDGRLRPQGAACALHDAVRTLRDAFPGEPRLWTPFAHIGP